MRPDRPFDADRRRAVVAASLAAIVPAAATASAPKDKVPAYVVKPWPRDRPVPEFDLVDLEGRRRTLAPLTGQVVLLNFWATWCEPCRAEMPSLEALALREIANGLTVLAVNYKEPAEKIKLFLQRNPFRPAIVLDADGDAASAWTPRVFPTTVVVGRGTRPVASVVGELDWTGPVARAMLEPLLAKRHW